MDSSLLDVALRYAGLGYAVFPCRVGSKQSLVPHGFRDATTDVAQIEAWWAQWPDANVAITARGLLVVDVDPQAGSWPNEQEQATELLMAGAVSQTPRGGRHYVFRRPPGKEWKCSAGQLAPGVDIRTDGGYVVVPPSRTTDGAYRWVPGLELDAPADRLPDPPDEPVTRPGDLWILGDHRLLCGDAGKAEDVDRLLDGNPVHLVNTDPPYNVRVEPRSNNAIAAGLSSYPSAEELQGGRRRRGHHQSMDVARHPEKSKPTHRKLRAKDRPLENDFVSDKQFDGLLHAWFGNIARVLEPGRGFYIWGGYANCANYPPVLKAVGLYFSQAIIWDKEHPVLTRKDRMGRRVERVAFAWERGKVVEG